MHASPSTSTAKPSSEADRGAAVLVSELVFAYPARPRQPVLQIDSWRVNRGEAVFLKGASGTGKSTLLNLLAGVLTPTSGQVQLLGTDLGKLSSRQRDRFRANHVGMVFQQFNLVPYLSVMDNLRLAAHFGPLTGAAAESKARHLFAALQLHESLFAQKAQHLSVGQQQRVAIARALINEPEVIIADEPTSALDSDLRDEFMAMLLSICNAGGKTLIFVSHDAAIAQHFEHRLDLNAINCAGLVSNAG